MALSSRSIRPFACGLWAAWALVLVVTVSEGHGDTRVGVVYNSNSSLQHKLYLATWLGFRDTLPEDVKPHLIDTRSRSPQEVAGWILTNHTTRIVSLLEPEELLAVIDGYKRLILDRIETQGLRRKDGFNVAPYLRIFLPRMCIDVHNYIVPRIGSLFQIECLQMDGDGRGSAMALLNRASLVGVKNLIPVTLQGPEAAHERDVQQLYRIYKEMVYMNMNLVPIKLERLITGERELQGVFKTHTGNSTSLGILVLDKNPGALAQILDIVSRTSRPGPLVHVFTPWGPEGMKSAVASTSMHYPSHLVYTVMYAGAGNRQSWSEKPRKRLLAELAEVMGHDPAIVTGVLAYDAATFVVDPDRIRNGHLLSGDYNPQPLSIISATRARTDGTFYGVSPPPKLRSTEFSTMAILQKSDYILEDMISISRTRSLTGNQFEVTDYEVPTATVFSSRDLDALALAADSKINCHPNTHGIRVTSWDPFTMVGSTYEFGHGHDHDKSAVPEYLLIPNQNGYGMELSCEHHEGVDEDDPELDPEERLITSFSLACTPNGNGASGVNCYRSGFSHRVAKRAAAAAAVLPPAPAPSGWVYYGAPYAENRDGDASMAYYPGGSPMGMGMGMDMVTAMSMASSTSKEPPMTTTEEPTTTTTPAPAPPPPPLPDLRMILRAAKPFIGGCIGTALGCAVCAIWLSRSVPILGVQPAICAGPCFTGTFGQCGGLLGRVGSETTVICTELFRQGRIDAVTFLADAEFGRRMRAEAPMVLKGYRLMAEPLVEAMRASAWVTDIVAVFAQPWARYMRRIVEEDDPKSGSSWLDLGAWIHWTGFPLCGFVGQLATWVEFVTSDQFYLLGQFLACACGTAYLLVTRKKMLEA